MTTTCGSRDFLKVTAATGLAAGAAAVATAEAQQPCANPECYVCGMRPLQVRRVVTGHDEHGRSVVAIDEIAGAVTSRRKGQPLLQRGRIHNWVNHGPAPCVVAFVLVAAEAARIGANTLGATG